MLTVLTPQVRTRNEVLLPSFQHGVGDPVEDNIVVATHHTLVLVEGNYLLIGAPNCSPPSQLPPAPMCIALQADSVCHLSAVPALNQAVPCMRWCCARALDATHGSGW
jgi:pantothenate kinase